MTSQAYIDVNKHANPTVRCNGTLDKSGRDVFITIFNSFANVYVPAKPPFKEIRYKATFGNSTFYSIFSYVNPKSDFLRVALRATYNNDPNKSLMVSWYGPKNGVWDVLEPKDAKRLGNEMKIWNPNGKTPFSFRDPDCAVQ